MHQTQSFSASLDHAISRRLLRPFIAMLSVTLIGTLGFMLVEDEWTIWEALYFTLITISTVGYGDSGVSTSGQAVAVVMIMMGIGTYTYAFGQIVQFAVGQQLAWRKRMQRHIDQLKDHFIVCGLGRVGEAVCRQFNEASLPIVVVDNDPRRTLWARDHGHLTVDGCATEDESLLRAGVKRARGIVCATSCDTENLAMTLTARELNPDITIICRADDTRSPRKYRRAGATHVVSPATNCGHDIASMLIRPHLAEFLREARYCESGFQLTEILIQSSSSLIGQTISDVSSKEDSIVIVALRHADGKTRIRPAADDHFREGDVVILAGELDGIVRIREQASTQGLSAAG